MEQEFNNLETSDEEQLSDAEKNGEIVTDPPLVAPRRSERERRLPAWTSDYEIGFIGEIVNGEPLSLAEAMNRCDSEKWREAVNAELKVLKENNTWTEIDKSESRDIIDSKWMFKLKNNEKVEAQYKARLVANGFQ